MLRRNRTQTTPGASAGRFDHPAGGFSLIEIMVVTALVGIIALGGFAVFNTGKGKARTAEPGQRITEVAASIESYRQMHGGMVAGITADDIREAYTSSPNVTVKVCTDWSQGTVAVNKYTVYAYVPSASGSATPLSGTKGWMLDSGTGSIPAQGTPTLCPTPVVI